MTLTRLFACGDRLVLALLALFAEFEGPRPKPAQHVRPEYLRGGHLPPVPTPARW